MDGDKNISMSCGGDEDAAEANGVLMMKHININNVFFYPVDVWPKWLV